MTTPNQRWLADTAIRVLVILKGSHVAKGGVALITIGGLLVRPDLYWIPLALVGVVSMDQAIQNSSPSTGLLIVGAMAMILGAVLLLSMMVTQWRSKAPALIALRHQSFDGNSRHLEAQDLPATLKGSEIVSLDVNQSDFFSNGVLTDPKAALRQQDSLTARLNGLLHAHPRASVAYCGKAHIPLAFAAAHAALSEVRPVFFELERGKGGWRWLDDAALGDDLGLRVEEESSATPSGEAVVRIEISYSIKRDDIAAIVPSSAADIRIGIAQPRIDCISTVAQVDAIAEAFRSTLDRLQAWPTPITRVHVFLAAPMSVVVALGRRTSPTIHKPLVVHNYSEKTVPRYAWGIEVNAASGPLVMENNVKAVA